MHTPLGHIGVCLTTLTSALSYLLGAPRCVISPYRPLLAPSRAVSRRLTPSHAVSRRLTPSHAVSRRLTPSHAFSRLLTPSPTSRRPRVLQALARDASSPLLQQLAISAGPTNEPLRALLLTWALTQTILLTGTVNCALYIRHPRPHALGHVWPRFPRSPTPPAFVRVHHRCTCRMAGSIQLGSLTIPISHCADLAPLVTALFLLSFCLINLLAFLAALKRAPPIHPPTYVPTFEWNSRWLALLGFVLSALTMAAALASAPAVAIVLVCPCRPQPRH